MTTNMATHPRYTVISDYLDFQLGSGGPICKYGTEKDIHNNEQILDSAVTFTLCWLQQRIYISAVISDLAAFYTQTYCHLK